MSASSAGPKTGFEQALARYSEASLMRGQSARTIEGRTYALRRFFGWCAEWDIADPARVSRTLIERYQRHLYYGGRRDGHPLSLATQRGWLTAVKQYFRWLARERWIATNPASELELPRVHRRLPKAVLTGEEVERVLAHTTLFGARGVRDRAMLETLYATGIRRAELIGLDLYDVDTQQGTLMVREGKGRKDRLLPIGERACAWIERYVIEVRPAWLNLAHTQALFLAEDGEALNAHRLGDLVRDYLDAAGIDKPGSCHLFRHTMATLMLDNGADLRFIQAMLGHADISTTTIYTQVSLRKLREVYERTHPAKALRSGRAGTDASGAA